MKQLSTTIALSIISLLGLSQNYLDSTFNSSGYINGMPTGWSKAIVSHLQSNGKIIVLAESDSSTYGLLRFHSSGALDTVFGQMGATQLISSEMRDMSIQSDDKIVIGGGGIDFQIRRYHPNGGIDSLFGNNGIVIENISTFQVGNPVVKIDYINDITIQNDGKIMAGGMACAAGAAGGTWAGCAFNYGWFHPVLQRYNTDGTTDTTFERPPYYAGGEPELAWLVPNYGDYGAEEILVQPDNKTVIASTNREGWCVYSHMVISRVGSDGHLDSTFSGNGVKVIEWGNPADFANMHELALQSDGKIIGAGDFVHEDGTRGIGLVRLDSIGVIDSTFGTNGIVFNTLDSLDPIPTEMMLLNNEKIAITGYTAGGDFFYARFNNDGSLDNQCGPGYFTINIDSTDNTSSATLQADGKILISGTSMDTMTVLRLNIDPWLRFTNYSAAACTSYGFNGQIYTVSGHYEDSLQTAQGCDSILYLDLIVYAVDSARIEESTCTEFIFNGHSYTTTGVFYDTLQSIHGCDSIVELDLIIYPAQSNELAEEVCSEFTFNGSSYTSTGIYYDTLQSIHGCDSIVELDLTINNADAQIMQEWDSLVSVSTGTNYQWINCQTGTAISGATQSTFDPDSNGTYAMVLTDNGCTDTSDCIDVFNVGVDERGATSFEVYPNPNNGLFKVRADVPTEKLEVFSFSGQLVYLYNTLGAQRINVQLDLPTGVYTLKCSSTSVIHTQTLIINK